MYSNRYIYDALYGRMEFPEYFWKILHCPELQRLREVRLCNINSLCLTGGANINRYEHSVGTAFLALKCVERWPYDIDKRSQRIIVMAALLHDILSTAFGHSVEYVIDSKGYEHNSLLNIFDYESGIGSRNFSYQYSRAQPIYFGMPRRLGKVLNGSDLKEISEIVSGNGAYGPLINGCIDLDNIDNVYRLSYHMGLVNSGNSALELARSIWVDDGELVIEDSACPLLDEWYEVRKVLYRYLLLNPDEFSAKCMLEESLEIAQARSNLSFDWNDVDFQLLEKLAKCSDEASTIVARIMIGDLYGCIGIYSTSDMEAQKLLSESSARQAIEKDIEKDIRKINYSGMKNAIIAIHIIKDLNKTQRKIDFLTSSGMKKTIGIPSRQILIGVFFKNVNLSMTKINEKIILKWNISRLIREKLEHCLTGARIMELLPYAEAIESTE